MEVLRRDRAEHNLDRRMRIYLYPKVLVTDSSALGLWLVADRSRRRFLRG